LDLRSFFVNLNRALSLPSWVDSTSYCAIMEAYCSERHIGAPLVEDYDSNCPSVTLPAAVLQYRPDVDAELVDTPWPLRQRDEATEIVVPLSIIQQLGKGVFAGQLVEITSSTQACGVHIGRLVPAELCKSRLLSNTVATALGIDETTCLTDGGQGIALLSPLLAHNLGLPYHLAELAYGSDLKDRETKQRNNQSDWTLLAK
jgi:hypothetical protein